MVAFNSSNVAVKQCTLHSSIDQVFPDRNRPACQLRTFL